MSFDINIIGTGSSGNSVIIDQAIMIDAGLPARTLAPHLAAVSAVLVTHHHGDHINPAVVNHLARHRPVLLQRRFHVNPSTRGFLESKLPRHTDCLRSCPTITGHGWNTTITTPAGDSYHIEAFQLVHDVENYGFIITNPQEERLIYATDTETMKHAPSGKYDYILVEGNWDEDRFTEMLASRDPKLIDRAIKNLRHLSVQKFEEFVRRHGHDRTVSYQLHVSDELGSRSLVGQELPTSELKRGLATV